MPRPGLRWAHIVAGVVSFGAVVPYKDPEPLRWMALYTAAAAVCWIPVHVCGMRIVAALVGLVALGWAATPAPSVLPQFEWHNPFRDLDPARPAIEESREMLGLLIVSGWMAVRAVRRTG